MTGEQRRTLAAAMERVLPSGDGPGAAEADAISYADWLAGQPGFQAASRRLAAGLTLLDSLATAMWGSRFAACRPAEQDAVLAKVSDTPHPTAQRFFTMVVKMTLAGFLCPPDYGGNRNRVGWQYIGFAPHPLTSGSGVVPSRDEAW